MVYFKLHLIRHGLTAGNLEGRYIGAGTDLPLCDEGRAQLAALKRDFTYPPVELVFTSPLLRRDRNGGHPVPRRAADSAARSAGDGFRRI